MPNTPSAAEIIERTKQIYASCRTYQDDGEQTTTVRHVEADAGLRSHTSKKRFRTAFVRPDMFFFEYREVEIGPESEWTHGIVCSNSHGVHTWWSLRSPSEEPGDLAHALGGFAGVTGGTSVDVPSLLLPSLKSGAILPDPASADLLEDEAFAGTPCHRIQGQVRADQPPVVVWIERSSGYLRRIDERSDFTEAFLTKMHEDSRRRLRDEVKDPAMLGATLRMLDEADKQSRQRPFSTEKITIWHPRMNIDIDPRVFEFVEPG